MTNRYAEREREFTRAEMQTIKAKIMAKFPGVVADVENEGMDPGRFFVHLNRPWSFNTDPYNPEPIRSYSFGGLREAYAYIKDRKVKGD